MPVTVPTKKENVLHRVLPVRLYPTAAQEAVMVRSSDARRWAWNWALGVRNAAYEAEKKSISRYELARMMTVLRQQSENAWLTTVSRRALTGGLIDLDAAYAAFFRELKEIKLGLRAPRKPKKPRGDGKPDGFPRFKSRFRADTTFTLDGDVQVRPDALYLQRIGWVRMRGYRSADDWTGEATVRRDATGRWYASVNYRIPHPNVPLITAAEPVGIDFGLKSLVVLSTGESVAAPKYFRAAARRLAHAQRTMDRRKPKPGEKASANYKKAKQDVARIQVRVANQRQDMLHRLSHELVEQHDGMAVENLNVAGMAKNKSLSKSIYDASWSTLRAMLAYKSEAAYQPFVAVDAAYTTMTCNDCGYVCEEPIPLKIRAWVCPECGIHHDRDVNAAKNIRDRGFPELSPRNTRRHETPVDGTDNLSQESSAK